MLFVIFIYTGILAYKLWGQWAQCQLQIYPKTGTAPTNESVVYGCYLICWQPKPDQYAL